MTSTSPQKPRRKLTNLELSAPARGALRRLKRDHGMSFTHAVEKGLTLVEQAIVIGEQMPAATRKLLGLHPNPPPNRRRPRTIGDVTIETANLRKGVAR